MAIFITVVLIVAGVITGLSLLAWTARFYFVGYIAPLVFFLAIYFIYRKPRGEQG